MSHQRSCNSLRILRAGSKSGLARNLRLPWMQQRRRRRPLPGRTTCAGGPSRPFASQAQWLRSFHSRSRETRRALRAPRSVLAFVKLALSTVRRRLCGGQPKDSWPEGSARRHLRGERQRVRFDECSYARAARSSATCAKAARSSPALSGPARRTNISHTLSLVLNLPKVSPRVARH